MYIAQQLIKKNNKKMNASFNLSYSLNDGKLNGSRMSQNAEAFCTEIYLGIVMAYRKPLQMKQLFKYLRELRSNQTTSFRMLSKKGNSQEKRNRTRDRKLIKVHTQINAQGDGKQLPEGKTAIRYSF